MITVFNLTGSPPEASINFTGAANPSFGLTPQNWSGVRISNLQNNDNFGGLSVENSDWTAFSFWIKPGWPSGNVATYPIGFIQYVSPHTDATIYSQGRHNNIWIAYDMANDRLVMDIRQYYLAYNPNMLIVSDMVRFYAPITGIPAQFTTGLSNIAGGNSWNSATSPDWVHLSFVNEYAGGGAPGSTNEGAIYWNGTALPLQKEEYQGQVWPQDLFGQGSCEIDFTDGTWAWSSASIDRDPHFFVGAIERDSNHVTVTNPDGSYDYDASSQTNGEVGTYNMDKLIWDRGTAGSVWTGTTVSGLYNGGAPGTNFAGPISGNHFLEWDFQDATSFQSATTPTSIPQPGNPQDDLQVLTQFVTGPNGTQAFKDTSTYVQ